MSEPTSLLETARTAAGLLADVAATPVAQLDDSTLVQLTQAVETAGRLIDTARCLTAAEIAERSRWELNQEGLSYRNGHRKPTHFLEQLTGSSPAEVAKRIKLGTAIRPRTSFLGEPLEPTYPRVSEAMLAGSISRDAASIITTELDKANKHRPNPVDAAIAEQELVTEAKDQPADLIAIQAKVWREALDPDGIEPREEEIRARRSLTLGRESHGLIPITGNLSPLCAAKLKNAFSEANAPGVIPRFLSLDETEGATEVVVDKNGDEIEIIRDPRTREQRQHDVLDGLLTAGLRSVGSEPGEMRPTTTVTAVIHLDDLVQGPVTPDILSTLGVPDAFIKKIAPDSDTAPLGGRDFERDFGPKSGYGWIDEIEEPVSAPTIQTLACGEETVLTIFDKNGAILWHGRTKRYFTKVQLKALAARDGGCVFCGAPASWCDVNLLGFTGHQNSGLNSHGKVSSWLPFLLRSSRTRSWRSSVAAGERLWISARNSTSHQRRCRIGCELPRIGRVDFRRYRPRSPRLRNPTLNMRSRV